VFAGIILCKFETEKKESWRMRWLGTCWLGCENTLRRRSTTGLYQLVRGTNHPGHLATGLSSIVKIFQAHRGFSADGDAVCGIDSIPKADAQSYTSPVAGQGCRCLYSHMGRKTQVRRGGWVAKGRSSIRSSLLSRTFPYSGILSRR
jgi:hypothetical protein